MNFEAIGHKYLYAHNIKYPLYGDCVPRSRKSHRAEDLGI